MRKLAFVAVLGATLMLCGCLVPEKFTASVVYDQDLGYRYEYEGTSAFVPALMEMAGNAPLPVRTEAAMRTDAAKYKANNADIRTLDYIGNARFKTVIAGQKPLGAQTEILNTLVIGHDKKGNQGVAIKLDAKDIAQFKSLQMDIQGRLVVKLPRKAEIVQTNGTVSKGFLGFGATTVEWVLPKGENRPFLLFKPVS